MLDGLRQLATLVQLVERDGLPLVETQHRVIAGEPCRFSAPATRLGEAGGGDGTSGRLFLTDRRTVFLGPSVTSAPWPAIAHVGRAGRDLLLSGASRRLEFRYEHVRRRDARGLALRTITMTVAAARVTTGLESLLDRIRRGAVHGRLGLVSNPASVRLRADACRRSPGRRRPA